MRLDKVLPRKAFDPFHTMKLFRHLSFLIFSTVCLLSLCGCGKLSQEARLPRKEIIQKITDRLPGYIEVSDVTLETKSRSSGDNSASFKLIMKSLEPLYVREKDPVLNEEVLVIAQKKGDVFNIYGSILYAKRIDAWAMGEPQFDNPLNFLGKPRPSFPPNILVKDSTEYTHRLEDIEKQRQIVIDLEKQKEQERQARFRKVRDFFKEGLVLNGNIIFKIIIQEKEIIQPITFKIISVKGDLFLIECSNPEQKGISQIFEGKVTDPLVGVKAGEAILNMRPRSPQEVSNKDVWKFYTDDGLFVLNIDDFGVSGEAVMSSLRYRLVFRN